MRPKVSIGVPVYNGARYLEECLSSLLAQESVDLEVLVGDNGSTDATPDICRRFAEADPRVSVHRSETNRGAAWNYNRLVSLAGGEYFVWAAHDDVHLPQFLARCVAELDGHRDASLCYTGVAEIDEEGKRLREYPFPEGYAECGDALTRVRDIVSAHTMCYEVFGVIRRKHLLDTDLIGSYWGSDRPLLAQLAMAGPFRHVDDLLFLSREHPDRMRYAPDWTAWHNTAHAGRPALPTWRIAREYWRLTGGTVGAARATWATRATILRWMYSRRRFLLRQLALWLWTLALQAKQLLRQQSVPAWAGKAAVRNRVSAIRTRRRYT